MVCRHPEKQKNQSSYSKKPDWIRQRYIYNDVYTETTAIVKENNLHTVCGEAACPNITECWSKKHASFLILGNVCTRACAFCNVITGKPGQVDDLEPLRVANAVDLMGLKHVVITSVNRDDLDDGGATHFTNTIASIRYKTPEVTIEILTPDFINSIDDIMNVAPPDVFNHNIETVPGLYRSIRPGSRYFRSLQLLYNVKNHKNANDIFTKSGFMVGLGEKDSEVYQLMDDLRSAGVDFLTIGQYLQPSPKHAPIDRFVHPDVFKEYEEIAYSKGFLMVSASPMTRSSYHADRDFDILRSRRKAEQSCQ